MKIGDKVRIIGNENHYFKIGDVGVISNLYDINRFEVKIKEIYQTVQKHEIELISENSF